MLGYFADLKVANLKNTWPCEAMFGHLQRTIDKGMGEKAFARQIDEILRGEK